MNIKTIASAVLAAVVLCAAPAFADGKMNLNTATEQELYDEAMPRLRQSRRGPRAGQGHRGIPRKRGRHQEHG